MLGAMHLCTRLRSVGTMDTERAVVYGIVSVILTTTLVSGPLVGAVDLTTEPEQSTPGSGNATISDVSLPSSAEISQGRYGAGERYLRVPDATVDLVDVTETPLLAYEISIRGLGYSRTTTHFISEANEGTFALSIERDSMAASTVQNDSYDGRLRVFLRTDGNERLLGSRNVTVEVTG